MHSCLLCLQPHCGFGSEPVYLSTEMTELRNVGSWKLNKAEEKELAQRVNKGEDEKTVKREIQTRKAQACEDRKKAATAIASKGSAAGATAKTKKGSSKKEQAVDPATAAAQSTDPTNAAYYAEVEADMLTIRKEFAGIDSESPMPLSENENDSRKSGVQEPYNVTKAKVALELHGVYRCSIPLCWVQVLSSPTPGIPMSRRRVSEMAEYYYPQGKPSFMTGRMVELLTDRNSLTDTPSGLQMISPEEIVHSLVAGCATAIRYLGCISNQNADFLTYIMHNNDIYRDNKDHHASIH